ncbi:MAG: glycosyl hydrolase family 18 protein [Treponema sp.]|jgi:hypothetical protein|nr:glycosyl hydrolase family 18 protein [Treponema sp.]
MKGSVVLFVAGALCGLLLSCVSNESPAASGKKPRGPLTVTDSSSVIAGTAQQPLNWNTSGMKTELPPSYKAEKIYGVPVVFAETWMYVLNGHEDELSDKAKTRITDLCYFSADIDCYGAVTDVPDRAALKNFDGRVHLVATSDSRSLTHFILDPAGTARRPLVDQLIAASTDFDGLQIDFELVPNKDGDNFRSFLAELKNRLPDKILSVCVPARTRPLINDVYDYAPLVPLVDKIFVMAYDEHWSNSTPGPIASVDWCRAIADYSVQTIPVDKLVMGVSFYGRTWGSVSVDKAWYYSGINRILRENRIHSVERDDGIPFFSYTTKLKVTGWFDDAYSIVRRNRMYSAAGVLNIGFWRAGFEDPVVWQWIKATE